MKFVSESPESKYSVYSYSGLNILLDLSDFCEESIKKAKDFCALHGYAPKLTMANTVYFLRGHTKHVQYDKILVGILEAENLPIELNEIIHCLTFWNQEGEDCYLMNGKKDESYVDFILKCIASDCRVFVEPYCNLFTTGTGGNHVWVNDKTTNERILIIHF